MESVIASHIRRIIQPTSNNHRYNCGNRAECPLDNKRLTTNIVWKAVVSALSKPDKKYFTISETKFKDRFRKHTRNFHHKKYVDCTELSKYIRKLKDKQITVSIKWNIMSIVDGTPNGGVCKLCLTEKFWFLKQFNDEHLLNKKSEFISKCKHKNKQLVKPVENGYFYLFLYCYIILVFEIFCISFLEN